VRTTASGDEATVRAAIGYLHHHSFDIRGQMLGWLPESERMLARIAGLALARAVRCGSKRDMRLALAFYGVNGERDGREDFMIDAQARFGVRNGNRLAA
jgi:hypothetical protein